VFDITEDKAKDIVRGFAIPAQPEILKSLQTENQREYPDISLISDIISQDVGLSAYLLKTINSPTFGLNRSVSDVKQAAMFLGLKALYNIVSFYELRSKFRQKNSAISLERFWDGSVESAKMCSLAVKHLNLASNCPVEYAYTIGLFHDCGIAAMATRFSDYKEILQAINKNEGQVFTHLEEAHYKTNHATVGYFVLSSWNMPDLICDFTARHHDPELFSDAKTDKLQRDLFAILKITDNVLARHHRGVNDTEWVLYEDKILDYFGLSADDYFEIEENLLDDFLTS